MRSERKLAANRLNAEKSTGPKTARGRSCASRNAVRHGLTSLTLRKRAPASAAIERLAKALYGKAVNPLLYEQALIIAECEIILRDVHAARIEAVEDMREVAPTVSPQTGGFPTTKEFDDGLQALLRGQFGPITVLLNRGARAIRADTAKRQALNALDQAVGEGQQAALRHEPAGDAPQAVAAHQLAPQTRDEVTAFLQALPQLVKLDRYERRALSRQRRAIRNFRTISILDAVS